jgi:hypothetical protein
MRMPRYFPKTFSTIPRYSTVQNAHYLTTYGFSSEKVSPLDRSLEYRIYYFNSLLQKDSRYIPPDQGYRKSRDSLALVQYCLSNEGADQAER